MMIKEIFLAASVLGLLAGCAANGSYQLTNVAPTQQLCNKMAKMPVYVSEFGGSDSITTDGVRPVVLPRPLGQMAKDALADFLHTHCGYRPQIDERRAVLVIEGTIREFILTPKSAQIIASVQIKEGKKILKSSQLTAKKEMVAFSHERAARALNLALADLNEQIYELLNSVSAQQ